MSNERSREAFMSFLDHLSEKGLIPQNTAASRKATAGKVFVVLSPDEAEDVTAIDLEAVMIRFENKNRGKYTSESLQTYRSRLKNALNEFDEFCANPFSFKPRRRVKAIPIKRLKVDVQNGSSDDLQPENRQSPQSEPVSHRPVVQVFPITLRPDLTIQIAGLPFDLTPAEAKKIANIILAHATGT